MGNDQHTSDTKKIDITDAATAEEFAASMTEIDDLCKRMRGLLEEHQPGNTDWLQAVSKIGFQLHTALGETFGLQTLDGSPMDTAIGFVCGQLDSTFERLGAWKDRNYQGSP